MGTSTDTGDGPTLARFVGRYRDEILAVLLIAIGATLLVTTEVDLVGGAMVLIGVAAWVGDWLAS
jgi:hypothetical protein